MANRGRHKQKSMQHLIVRILGEKIANRMMKYQLKQGNISNLDVFLRDPSAGNLNGGFKWSDTTEGLEYWYNRANELRNHPLYKQYKNDRR